MTPVDGLGWDKTSYAHRDVGKSGQTEILTEQPLL